MKRKLLKLTVLLLCMMGVSETWAQTTIYATKQMNFRTNSATEPNGWNTGSNWGNPLTYHSGLVKESVEISTKTACIFVTEQFVIPNWSDVKSIRIEHNGTGNSGYVAVWYFPYNFYEANAYSSDFINNVKTVLGAFPGSDYTNTPVFSGNVSGDLSVSDINTNYSSYISDNTLTLNILLTSTNTQDGSHKPSIRSAKESNGYNRPYVKVEYNHAVTNKTTGESYSTLNEAFSHLTDADTELEVSSDQIITSRLTWSNTNSHSVTITPTADIMITASGTNYMWFLVNKSNASMTIGSSDHGILFDGKGSSYGVNITKKEEGSNLTLTNVTFKNFTLTSEGYISGSKSYGSGYIQLDNIAIDNCTTAVEAFIKNDATANDLLRIKGVFNITNSTGTTIHTAQRIKLGDTQSGIYNGFSASNTITINWGGTKAIEQLVVVKVPEAQQTLFDLADTDYGLYWVSGGGDLKIAQAYPLTVTDAGAATLVLPYATRIPSGVSAYTLTHTDGESKVTASAVETTLDADKPVLINADEGRYKFVCTSNDATTKTSGSVTVGALTGQYEELTFTDENKADRYILNKVDDTVGFYKAATGKKVAANRAYLTATGLGAGVHGLSIVFDDDDVTAIESVNREPLTVNQYYDLGGRRVEKPTKGLYIVNGKKVIIK